MTVVLVEPPKDFWFIIGQYIPPPFGLLCLAAYLAKEKPGPDVIVDSQSEDLDWSGLEKRLNELEPDLVASSALATANTYYGLGVCQLTKAINQDMYARGIPSENHVTKHTYLNLAKQSILANLKELFR